MHYFVNSFPPLKLSRRTGMCNTGLDKTEFYCPRFDLSPSDDASHALNGDDDVRMAAMVLTGSCLSFAADVAAFVVVVAADSVVGHLFWP